MTPAPPRDCPAPPPCRRKITGPRCDAAPVARPADDRVSSRPVLWIEADDPVRADDARRLAARLGGTLVTPGTRLAHGRVRGATTPPVQETHDGDVILRLTASGPVLRSGAQPERGGYRPDHAALAARPPGRRSALGRALGDHRDLVVDATAGLGEDTVLLAALAPLVIAIERSPLGAYMIECALAALAAGTDRARAIARRIDLRTGDARTILPTLDPAPDVIYLDPMFEPRRRASALAPLPLRLLRAVVGDDPDAADLLAIARRTARRRVVVKRRGRSPVIDAGGHGDGTGTDASSRGTPGDSAGACAGDTAAGGASRVDARSTVLPDHVIRGTLLRYDVYLIRH